MKQDSNETVELLKLSSSDSEYELPNSSFPPSRRKLRKKRNGGASKRETSSLCKCDKQTCWSFTKAAFVIVAVVALILPIGLTAQLWFKVDKLLTQLHLVEAGNRATPQELHNVHTQLQQLDRNYTRIEDDLGKIMTDLAALSKQVEALGHTTESLQLSIASAPQLQTLPKDVESLSKSVASMGSKVADVETVVKDLKTQHSQVEEERKKMVTDFSLLQNSVEDIQKLDNQSKTTIPSVVSNFIKHLEESLEDVNTTLGKQVNFALEDLHIHHGKINDLENRTRSLSELVHSSREAMTSLVNQTLQEELGEFSPFVTKLISEVDKHISEELKILQNAIDQLQNKSQHSKPETLQPSSKTPSL